MKVIEVPQTKKIVTSKTYSAVHDSVSNVAKDASFYPQKNFTDFISHEVKTRMQRFTWNTLSRRQSAQQITSALAQLFGFL